jgi:hypothetical protein
MFDTTNLGRVASHLNSYVLCSISNYDSNWRCMFIRVHVPFLYCTKGVLHQFENHEM